MKLNSIFIILLFCLGGCHNKELPDKYLSHLSVVRETENNHKTESVQSQPKTYVSQPSHPRSLARYHIIVASFSYAEKARAEKLVSRLKAKNYPATLIHSAQRYRVSIENFATEAEANSARDEYRIATDRQDIWVHKVD